MSNKTITNVDLGNVVLTDGRFRDDTAYAAESTDLVAGTILARSTAEGASEDLLVPFAPGGADGAGTPVAVLTYDLTVNTATPARVMVAGEVRKERLVIHADGDDSNVDDAVIDALRQTSLIPLDVEQLARLDNQP